MSWLLAQGISLSQTRWRKAQNGGFDFAFGFSFGRNSERVPLTKDRNHETDLSTIVGRVRVCCDVPIARNGP